MTKRYSITGQLARRAQISTLNWISSLLFFFWGGFGQQGLGPKSLPGWYTNLGSWSTALGLGPGGARKKSARVRTGLDLACAKVLGTRGGKNKRFSKGFGPGEGKKTKNEMK